MEETALKIRVFGDPLLRKKAKAVGKITDRHRAILSEMAQIMYGNAGIGLAAPQVGVSEAMIIADTGSGLYKLINPQIVKKEGEQAIEEGCLSVPGVCFKIKRARKVTVEAEDEFAKPVSLEAEGLLACVFQHEIDHLKGRLIVDYASFLDKIKIGKRLKELSRQANKIKGGIPPAYQVGLAGKQRSEDERMPQSEAKSCKLQL